LYLIVSSPPTKSWWEW